MKLYNVLIITFIFFLLGCSKPNLCEDHRVCYNSLIGTRWYGYDTDNAVIDEYIFMRDTLKIYKHQYDQTDYHLISTRLIKGPVWDKDVSYYSVDDNWCMYRFLVYFKEYSDERTPVTSYDTEIWMFIADKPTATELKMGPYNEYEGEEGNQLYYTLTSYNPLSQK